MLEPNDESWCNSDHSSNIIDLNCRLEWLEAQLHWNRHCTRYRRWGELVINICHNWSDDTVNGANESEEAILWRMEIWIRQRTSVVRSWMTPHANVVFDSPKLIASQSCHTRLGRFYDTSGFTTTEYMNRCGIDLHLYGTLQRQNTDDWSVCEITP